MAPPHHSEETMLHFTYKLKLTERVKAKCSRHPRYNPVKDGRAGIRGGCSTCFSLYDLHQEGIALDAAQREFVRRAGPWARQREPRPRKGELRPSRPTSRVPNLPRCACADLPCAPPFPFRCAALRRWGDPSACSCYPHLRQEAFGMYVHAFANSTADAKCNRQRRKHP